MSETAAPEGPAPFGLRLDPHGNDIVEWLDRLDQKVDGLTELVSLQVADWLTIEHAALVCDCSYDHIYRAVERGELPASDIGNGEKKALHRISRSDLNAWMERNRGRTAAVPPRSELDDLVRRHLPGLRGRKDSATR
jgi:excisionase family DNA binding protein